MQGGLQAATVCRTGFPGANRHRGGGRVPGRVTCPQGPSQISTAKVWDVCWQGCELREGVREAVRTRGRLRCWLCCCPRGTHLPRAAPGAGEDPSRRAMSGPVTFPQVTAEEICDIFLLNLTKHQQRHDVNQTRQLYSGIRVCFPSPSSVLRGRSWGHFSPGGHTESRGWKSHGEVQALRAGHQPGDVL